MNSDKNINQTDEAENKVKPPEKKKHGWIWNVVLVAVIALGIYTLFRVANEITDGDLKPIWEVIAGANGLWTAILLCVVLGVVFFDSCKFCFINKAVTGKFKVAAAIKTNLLGKYYDAVTPFSTGGQPMQIYYLTTKGISGGNSSAIVLIRYSASIFCWLTIGAAFMIAGVIKGVLNGVTQGTLLLVTGWVGLAVNLIVPLFLVSFVVFPKMAHKLTSAVIALSAKLKIVKDRQKAMDRALKTVNDFISSFRIMVRRPLWLILLIIVCLGEAALTFSMPYFVMKALSCGVDGMFFSVMVLNVFVTFGVSFIPTPGNAGVIETMSVLAFSFAGALLAWAVMFWRFAVYYLYIIIGIVLTVFDLIYKNVRKKVKPKNE